MDGATNAAIRLRVERTAVWQRVLTQVAGRHPVVPDAPGAERKRRCLPRGSLSWLLRLLTGCRSSSISKAEVVATSATITWRLHALLATVVVSGIWRDFLPRRLRSELVLGKVEQWMRKVEIDSAGLA